MDLNLVRFNVQPISQDEGQERNDQAKEEQVGEQACPDCCYDEEGTGAPSKAPWFCFWHPHCRMSCICHFVGGGNSEKVER